MGIDVFHGDQFQYPADEGDDPAQEDEGEAEMREVGKVAECEGEEQGGHINGNGVDLRLGGGEAKIFEDGGLERCSC